MLRLVLFGFLLVVALLVVAIAEILFVGYAVMGNYAASIGWFLAFVAAVTYSLELGKRLGTKCAT